jgi:hypothetical protein
MMAISRAELLKELMPGLNALFDKTYDSYNKPKYKMRCVYGKYRIYKSFRGVTTTLAKNLTKEAATGMMKLLEEDDE